MGVKIEILRKIREKTISLKKYEVNFMAIHILSKHVLRVRIIAHCFMIMVQNSLLPAS